MQTKSTFAGTPTLLFIILSFLLGGYINAQSYCTYNDADVFDFGITVTSSDKAVGVLKQPDGKVVIYGTSFFSSANNYRVSLMRLNTDLTIDSTGFGNSGKVTHTWSQRNTCLVAELQNDGKILVGGVQATSNGFSTFRPYVGRFNADGSVDTTFGTSGSVLISSYGIGKVSGIKEVANGKIRIVIDRYSPKGIIVMQFNSNGTIDTSFGSNGMVYHPIPNLNWSADFAKVLFTADTSAVVVTNTYSGGTHNPLIVKLLNNGNMDTTFGSNGMVSITYPFITTFTRGMRGALTTSEDIIIGASSGGGSVKKMFLYKINGQTGSIDSTFATNGRIESTQTGGYCYVMNIVVDPVNDDIYTLAGFGTTVQRAATWRVSASGTEINQCGGNPIKLYPLGYQFSGTFNDAYFTCDGEIRMVGTSGEQDPSSPASSQGLNYIIPQDTTPLLTTLLTESACNTYTSPSGNHTWNTSGSYMDTLTAISGCDSLLLIDLTILNSTTSSVAPVVCGSYTSPSGMHVWTSSGTYLDTIPNAAGCDSVITVNLTVHNPTSFTMTSVVCGSFVSPSGNYTWTSSGTYTDTLINSAGCDSVITVHLTVNHPTTATFDVTACDHYVSPSGIHIWLSSGTYTDTITNSAGCDSIITVNLTIFEVDTAVTVNGFILTATASNAQFQWLDCTNNYAIINGATGSTFVPQTNGTYAVQVIENGCTDTSGCHTVVGVGIEEQGIFGSFKMYPNPNSGTLYLELGNIGQAAIHIYSANGQLVYQEQRITEKQHQIRFDAPAGVYIFQIESSGQRRMFKLIVQ